MLLKKIQKIRDCYFFLAFFSFLAGHAYHVKGPRVLADTLCIFIRVWSQPRCLGKDTPPKPSHLGKYGGGSPSIHVEGLDGCEVKNCILYMCLYFLRVVYGHICACSGNNRFQYIKSCYYSVGIMILSKTIHASHAF